MFIKVKRFNMDVLLNVHKIEAVVPMDEGKTTSIKAEGHSFECSIPFDQAQDVLIDCAAQVSAPIASRVLGLDNTIARLSRSVEDMLEKFNTPIIGPYSPEEEAEIRRTLEGTRRTLDSITSGPCTVTDSMLESDIKALITLLENREYAEHWASTKIGGKLEGEITKLIGHDNAASNRLKRAEELLRIVAEDSRRWPDLYSKIDSKLIQSVRDFADSTNS